MSLAEAKVVVSAGRGAGSPEGFGIIEELAGLLGGAVGCSRAVTMAGWRPHTDQVGQTGTKIAPEIYIACGISGATQHMAGCKGAKALLAINTDPDAPILASADYAVIGDLHEVVPAISAELRKARAGLEPGGGERRLRGRPLVVAIAVAGGLFARRALFLTRVVRSGKPVARASDIPARVRNEATIVLGQRKLLQRLVPGLMHAFIFWGFLVLFPTIFMAIVAIVDREQSLPAGSPLGWLESQGWYALLVDLFVVLVLAGVATAFFIRKVQRPRRFEGSHLGEADLILALIAGIVTTLLLWHASLIALGLNPWPAEWSPVSNAVSDVFGDGTTTDVLERVFVWAHVLIILGFLAYLPHSKHLHIATAAINVFFGSTRARGRLEPLDFEAEDESGLRFGAGTVADLTWKQMLDAMSCTECGRCQDVCPAFATGKALSPKLLIMGIRDQLFAEGSALVAGGDLPHSSRTRLRTTSSGTASPAAPACTSARSRSSTSTTSSTSAATWSWSNRVSPLTRRRCSATSSAARTPGGSRRPSARLGRKGSASASSNRETRHPRSCTGSAAPLRSTSARGRRQSRRRSSSWPRGSTSPSSGRASRARAIPRGARGTSTSSSRSPKANVATLEDAGVTKIVASCPHCFNTLANEYPDFGGRYEVMHHSELLAELVRDGRLSPIAGEATITYHDSCYLARHNDVLAAPRELVGRIGRPLEMARSGRRTFCCGAGGAHMWMEERGSQINEERAREAAATGADTLAVACPFCTVMLDDGVRQTGSDLRVADVSTLLAEALEHANEAPPVV